jgi:hypothetical protein
MRKMFANQSPNTEQAILNIEPSTQALAEPFAV